MCWQAGARWVRRVRRAHAEWHARLAASAAKGRFPRAGFARSADQAAPALEAHIAALAAEKPAIASRVASQKALVALTAAIPQLIGGSADLTGSNNTDTPSTLPFTAEDYSGRYIYYGIREFGMAAAMNGMALHGGVVPYGGTFLIFSDYARNAVRLSALCSRSAWSMCSRMIPSALAKTARPTSRWNR